VSWPSILAIIQFKLKRRIQSSNAEVGIRRCHIMEAHAQPFGGILSTRTRSFVRAGADDI
jgi:hypothetical protein